MNLSKNSPFKKVLDEIEGKYQAPKEKYSNFDGDTYDNVYYDYADGSEEHKVKLYQADPYQIIVENNSDQAKTAILFGNDKHLLKPRFGNPNGIVISIGQPGVEYVELLQQSSTKPFSTQFMRIESENKLQLSKFITVYQKDANGNLFQRPMNMQQFKSAYQNQDNMLDAPINEYVDGTTYWEVGIEPKTRVLYTIFPLYKVDTSSTLRGAEPIKSFAPAKVNTGGLVMKPQVGQNPIAKRIR